MKCYIIMTVQKLMMLSDIAECDDVQCYSSVQTIAVRASKCGADRIDKFD